MHSTPKLKFASWNIQAVADNHRLHALEQTLSNSHFDIVALQSTCRNTSDTGPFYLTTPLPHSAGVGFYVNPILSRRFSILHRSPRIMVASLNFLNSNPLTLVNFYAPTAGANATDRNLFWRDLHSVVSNLLPSHKINIIACGDANAHIHPNSVNFIPPDPASHPLHTDSNGHDLLAFAATFNLRICNFLHQHPWSKLWTHQSNNHNSKSLIDYILSTQQDWAITSVQCKTPAFATDHRLLLANITGQTAPQPSLRSPPNRKRQRSSFNTLDGPLRPIGNLILQARREQQITPSAPQPTPSYEIAAHQAVRAYHNAWRASNRNNTAKVRKRRKTARKAVTAARKHKLNSMMAAINSRSPPMRKDDGTVKGIAALKLAFRSLRSFYKPRDAKRHKSHQHLADAAQLYFRDLLADSTLALRQAPTPTHTQIHLTPHPPDHLPTITLFTDGSHIKADNTTNPPTPAYGGFSFYSPSSNLLHYGHIPQCNSSYQAEAHAILYALHAHPNMHLHIHTDSLSCIHTIRSLRKHVNTNFCHLEHPNIWRTIWHLLGSRSLTLTKVKAHSGILHNEIADAAAQAGAQTTTAPLISCTLPHTHIKPTSEEIAALPHTNHPSFPDYQGPADHRPPTDTPPTEYETAAAINHISNSAAPGPDSISASELKTPEIIALLHTAIADFWDTGTLPPHWTDCTIVSLPKPSGGIRGIALLQALYKILATIIQTRLTGQPLMRHQLGFSPGRSTLHGIRAAQSFIEHCTTSESLTGYICFIDLTKAFDKVNRHALLDTLQQFHIGPNISRLIAALLNDHIQCKVDDSVSQPFTSLNGVKQGCPLSPLLFVLCLEIVFSNIQHTDQSHIIAYADDIAILSLDPQELKHIVLQIESLLHPFGLSINYSKTEIMTCKSSSVLSRDSTSGHITRSQKIQAHHAQQPIEHTYFNTRTNTLQIPKLSRTALYCPFHCPYIAAISKRRNSLLKTHLAKSHGMPLHTYQTAKVVMAQQVQIPDPLPRASHPISSSTPAQLSSPDPHHLPFIINGHSLKHVSTFKYLGYILHAGNSNAPNLAHRYAAATLTFNRLTKFWKSKRIRLQLKSYFFKAIILPTLLYGHETWSLTVAETRTLTRLYHRFARRASCAKPTLRPDGTYVKAAASTARRLIRVPPLPHLLDAGKLRLLGDIMRGEQHLPQLTSHIPTPERVHRGTPSPTWIEQCTLATITHQLTPNPSAYSRKQWSKAIRQITKTTLPPEHNTDVSSTDS